jgi:lysophospholipase L1-like esterase
MKLRSLLVPLFLAAFVVVGSFAYADDARPVVSDTDVTLQKPANPNLPTLYVVGDSTANSNAPLRGWGSEVGAFFDPAKINVINRAIGGRSSRTFITEGRWDRVLAELKPGDFVMVQFGHNDNGNYLDPAAKGRPSIRGEGEDTAQAVKSDLVTMETIHTYGWYMRKYAADAKAKRVTVFLLGMVPHKDWVGGHIKRDEQNTFVKWTKDAAQTEGAQFIDTNTIIAKGLEKLGPAEVDTMFGDARTHSTPKGAHYNAAAVVAGLKGLNPDPLGKYFSAEAGNLPPTLTQTGSGSGDPNDPMGH